MSSQASHRTTRNIKFLLLTRLVRAGEIESNTEFFGGSKILHELKVLNKQLERRLHATACDANAARMQLEGFASIFMSIFI